MSTPLKQMFESTKTLGLVPQWLEHESGRFAFTAPLEIDGVIIEGLLLRGGARKSRPDEHVMFQLECHSLGLKGGQLARIDWRPFHEHRNPARGPEQLRLKQIVGSHHHAFDLNYREDEDIMRQKNLPIARTLEPDPSNFASLLVVVGQEFRISGLDRIKAPAWEAELF